MPRNANEDSLVTCADKPEPLEFSETINPGSDINFLVKAPGGDLEAFFQSPDAKIWSPKGVHKKVLLQIIHRNIKLLNSFEGSASNTRIPYS